MSRDNLVAELATAITALKLTHPTRVAIDGRSAAGKTTLAAELASAFQAGGRDVLRASLDDFHRPGHKHRSRAGAWTPRSYYDEGFDYTAFRRFVLEPLGPDGNRRCRPALFDSLHDVWLPEVWRTATDQTIAIVDGAFLLRPDLVGHWDYVIWLDIDFETMVARARERDVAWVGLAAVVEDRYRRHWIPTHLLYERLTSPASHAQIVIDNRLPHQPTVLRRASP